ncbi:MAG TPA: tRNA pseudouridine(55) synthase TruB [Anaerovoracaceae bacterium]|nr:tRNA pseudouridine(55) synthase TruB [Anaerovoracaceae bacterium]
MKIDSGIININKPEGLTSHDVVSLVRKKLGIKRVGHTGTLDPMATGVLPICFGKATRIIEYLDYDFKSYNCDLLLGISTDTLDVTGEILGKKSFSHVTEEMINKVFNYFLGDIMQVPPKYSALKVNGRRLYDYARKGEDVEIKSRETHIESIDINRIDLNEGKVNFNVKCSKGTYIRSICRDVGDMLDTYGTMSSLVRTSSGIFEIYDSINLEDFKDIDLESIVDLIKAVDYPLTNLGKCTMEMEYSKRFLHGQRIANRNVNKIVETNIPKSYAMYVDDIKSNEFLGIALYEEENNCYKATKVIGVIDENI